MVKRIKRNFLPFTHNRHYRSLSFLALVTLLLSPINLADAANNKNNKVNNKNHNNKNNKNKATPPPTPLQTSSPSPTQGKNNNENNNQGKKATLSPSITASQNPSITPTTQCRSHLSVAAGIANGIFTKEAYLDFLELECPDVIHDGDAEKGFDFEFEYKFSHLPSTLIHNYWEAACSVQNDECNKHTQVSFADLILATHDNENSNDTDNFPDPVLDRLCNQVQTYCIHHSAEPSALPTKTVTGSPTIKSTKAPIPTHTSSPTDPPTSSHTSSPTDSLRHNPTKSPTVLPTPPRTSGPTDPPINNPTTGPTDPPTNHPTTSPTDPPTNHPTTSLTDPPADHSTMISADPPTNHPTPSPSYHPSNTPSGLAWTMPMIEVNISLYISKSKHLGGTEAKAAAADMGAIQPKLGMPLTADEIHSVRGNILIQDVLVALANVLCDDTDYRILTTESWSFFDFCNDGAEVSIPVGLDGSSSAALITGYKDSWEHLVHITDRRFLSFDEDNVEEYLYWTMWTVKYPVLLRASEGTYWKNHQTDFELSSEADAILDVQKTVDRVIISALLSGEIDNLLTDDEDHVFAASSVGSEVDTFSKFGIVAHDTNSAEDPGNSSIVPALGSDMEENQSTFWQPLRIVGFLFLILGVGIFTWFVRVGGLKAQKEAFRIVSDGEDVDGVDLTTNEGLDFMLATSRLNSASTDAARTRIANPGRNVV